MITSARSSATTCAGSRRARARRATTCSTRTRRSARPSRCSTAGRCRHRRATSPCPRASRSPEITAKIVEQIPAFSVDRLAELLASGRSGRCTCRPRPASSRASSSPRPTRSARRGRGVRPHEDGRRSSTRWRRPPAWTSVRGPGRAHAVRGRDRGVAHRRRRPRSPRTCRRSPGSSTTASPPASPSASTPPSATSRDREAVRAHGERPRERRAVQLPQQPGPAADADRGAGPGRHRGRAAPRRRRLALLRARRTTPEPGDHFFTADEDEWAEKVEACRDAGAC